MYLNILYLHSATIIIFSLYILTDRIYIRNFVEKVKRETFYKKSRLALILNTFLMVLSGFYMLFFVTLTPFVVLKIITALLLLYGFFNCPFYMKKEGCEIRKFMYRFGVLILLVVTIILGFNLQQ